MGLARAMSTGEPRGRRWLGWFVASLSVGVVAWRFGHTHPPGLVVSLYGCLVALGFAIAAWGLGTFALRGVQEREPPVDGLTQVACATALGFVLWMAILQLGGLALGSLRWAGALPAGVAAIAVGTKAATVREATKVEVTKGAIRAAIAVTRAATGLVAAKAAATKATGTTAGHRAVSRRRMASTNRSRSSRRRGPKSLFRSTGSPRATIPARNGSHQG